MLNIFSQNIYNLQIGYCLSDVFKFKLKNEMWTVHSWSLLNYVIILFSQSLFAVHIKISLSQKINKL